MAKGKIYKNMNTLFERVKTGKVGGNVAVKTFSNINYFKKKELVKPYLHSIDQMSLDNSIDNYIQSDSINNGLLEKTVSRINTIHKSKGETTVVDKATVAKQMRDVYKSFPKEIGRDVFNQYYSDIKKLNFEDRSDYTKNRYKMIDKANDPVTKVITRDSSIKSMIYSRNMIQYYISMLTIIKAEDPQGYEKLMNDIKKEGANQKPQNGNGCSKPGDDKQSESQPQKSDDQSQQDGDTQSDAQSNSQSGSNKGDSKQKNNDSKSALDKIMEKFLDKPDSSSQSMYEQAMQQAKDTSEKIDKIMSKDDVDELWDKLSYNSASALQKIDDKYLTEIEQKLTSIDMNGDKLKPYLKKILDKSFSYFNGKEEHIYDEFLNSPDISEILDFELLHPKLRKFYLEDIQVKTTKKIGKINVYVDISGSMGTSANISEVRMTRLTFAKAVLLRLKKMDVIDEIFTFNNNVKKRNTDVTDILTINGSGGTSIDTVINHVDKLDKNAIIITDADDIVYQYSDKAFFIGVAGADFRHIKFGVREQYVSNKQLIQFNGDDVYNIGFDGLPIR